MILIGIVLYLQLNLRRKVIFVILSLLIHKYGIFLHLFVYSFVYSLYISSISLSNGLQSSEYESLTIKIIPKSVFLKDIINE